MKGVLLDTNADLWLVDDSPRLGPIARSLISANEVWVSAASLWEVTIKRRIGKLHIDGELGEALRRAGVRELPIGWSHAHAIDDVELPHRDPFDRLLVTQARVEGLTFVTADRAILTANLSSTQGART